MPKIKIKLERGAVISVEDIPPDIVLEIFDYDVEKYRNKQLSADENGKLCDIREWHSPE